MPKTDPRETTANSTSPNSSQPPSIDAANTVQSEVLAVTQQLASDVSADAYAVGLQTAEYVNQRAFASFMRGYNEGAAKATSPFLQLRQQLAASKPKPVRLFGSTSTATPENCPASE